MSTVTTPPATSPGTALLDSPYPLTDEQVAHYQRDGFIRIANVLHGAELKRLRDAVAAAVEQENAPRPAGAIKSPYEQIFIQKVNLWRRHPVIAEFVRSRRLGELAARLCGRPVRVWHDQALFKEPREGAKTPWHQDAVYWPHKERAEQITIWIALKDANIENGCMSFVPGTHKLGPVDYIDLANPRNIFDSAPQFKGIKPTTCELKAGSATFHNGLTFHYAGPNKSDGMREAFAVIYMPDGTHFDGRPHIVTEPLGLKVGDRLEGEVFPLVG
jgi:ectoine hydroxylase-related dioxygenase (phytanoyl-CoA dioxygenase family)